MIALPVEALPEGYDIPGSEFAGPMAGAEPFREAVFRASVQSLIFTAQGDVRITINVPYSDRALALPLSDAHGILLNCRFVRKIRGGSS